jgi:hypothetical protein
MPTDLPSARRGRKKLPEERRFCRRVVFRLLPEQYDLLARRADAHGMQPNEYARDRALGRVRPTRAQRRLANEAAEPLEEVAQFVAFAHALLSHLGTRLDPEGELAGVVRQARERFQDPVCDVAALRTLIGQAVHP